MQGDFPGLGIQFSLEQELCNLRQVTYLDFEKPNNWFPLTEILTFFTTDNLCESLAQGTSEQRNFFRLWFLTLTVLAVWELTVDAYLYLTDTAV